MGDALDRWGSSALLGRQQGSGYSYAALAAFMRALVRWVIIGAAFAACLLGAGAWGQSVPGDTGTVTYDGVQYVFNPDYSYDGGEYNRYDTYSASDWATTTGWPYSLQVNASDCSGTPCYWVTFQTNSGNSYAIYRLASGVYSYSPSESNTPPADWTAAGYTYAVPSPTPASLDMVVAAQKQTNGVLLVIGGLLFSSIAVRLVRP